MITEANFKKTNLLKAVFRYARIVQADFTGSDLTDANLSLSKCPSKLKSCNLTRADLQGCDLRNADLTNATLQGAVLTVDRTYEQLSKSMKRAEFSFQLDNDDALVDHLVDLVRQILINIQACDSTEEMRVCMALEESLHRAIFCGNLELTSHQAEQARSGCEEGNKLALERRWQSPYHQRQVYFDVSIQPDEARFTVRHEGAATLLSDADLSQMVASGDQSDRCRVLMQTFMDEVLYEAEGRQVTMIKRAAAADRICATT